jgi:HSP20 family protein
MLMRSDPFRELDRLNEQLFDGPRARAMSMDAYRTATSCASISTCPGLTRQASS